MKVQVLKYGLILSLVIGFTNCNFNKSTLITNVEFDSLAVMKVDMYDILGWVENNNPYPSKRTIDSMIENAKLYKLKIKIVNNSSDSVLINGSILMDESILTVPLEWNKINGWHNSSLSRWITTKSVEIIPPQSFKTIFRIEAVVLQNDSMMFRYKFKIGRNNELWNIHDVYYTFKNDSFIIIRQTEKDRE